MSTRIADYKFTDYDNWTAAKSKLSAFLGNTYGNCITTETTDNGSVYWITIWDECDYSREAGQICSANCGTPI